jgi:hypothetical protein
MAVELIESATGKPVQVADNDAAKFVASGKFTAPVAGIPMTTADGLVGMVATKDVARAMQSGQRGATRDEFAEAKDQALYDNSGKAAALGFVRGAGSAFALPTDAILGDAYQGDAYKSEGFFADDTRFTGLSRADISGYKRRNPYASMGGELAGLVGATLLTDGGALGGAGATGAKLFGKGLGGALARGAIEGGILGGVEQVNESALGGTELTAEKMLTAIGHGALMGGAGAGVFHGVGELGSRALRSASEGIGGGLKSLATRAFGEAAPGLESAMESGLGSRLRDKYVQAAALASGAEPEALQALTRGGAAGREARRIAVYESDAVLDSAARAMRTQGDTVIAGNDVIYNQARGAMKRSYVEAAVQRGNEPATKAMVSNLVDDALTRSARLIEDQSGHTSILESLSKSAYRATGAAETNAERFIALDQFKRETQTLMKQAKTVFQRTSDPTRQLQAEATYNALGQVEERLRTSLEDQALINKQWVKSLDAKERFDAALTTRVGRGNFHDIRARDQLGIDPAKAEAYVRNLTNPNKDLTHTAIRDYIDATDSFAKTLADRYELPAETAQQLERAQDATKAFRGEVDKAEKTITLVNQYKALGGNGAADGLGAIGALTGGVVGGAVGTVAGAVVNPRRAVAQLAAMERLASHVDSKLNGSISRLYSGEIGTSSASRVLNAAGSTPAKTFESQVRAVQEMATTGAARIQDRIARIADVAPTVASTMATKAASISQFLAAKAPPGFNTQATLFPGTKKPVYSTSEMVTWARYAAAANNPLSIVDSLQQGNVSPQEVEVVREFYPQLYGQIQTKLMEHISKSAAEGVYMPRNQRLQLGTMFGVAADVDMTPEFKDWLNTVQSPQASAGAPPNQAPMGKSMNVSVGGNANTEGQSVLQ